MEVVCLALLTAILLAAITAVALGKRLPWHGTVWLAAAQGLFWGWRLGDSQADSLAAAICLQVSIFVLLLAMDAASFSDRHRMAKPEERLRLVLNGWLFVAAAWTLLHREYALWMSPLVLLVATIEVALGWLVLIRRPNDRPAVAAALIAALGLAAVVIACQTPEAWIALAWAVEGLTVWRLGSRFPSKSLKALGTALVFLAAGRVVILDTLQSLAGSTWPLLNPFFVSAVGVAGGLLAVSAIARSRETSPNWRRRFFSGTIRAMALMVAWLAITKETFQFCDRYFGRQTALEVLAAVWLAYAGAVWALPRVIRSAGGRQRSAPSRQEMTPC